MLIMSIGAFSPQNKSHLQAFLDGAYHYSQNSPTSEKVLVVANYFFSILIPLYPAGAILAFFIHDLYDCLFKVEAIVIKEISDDQTSRLLLERFRPINHNSIEEKTATFTISDSHPIKENEETLLTEEEPAVNSANEIDLFAKVKLQDLDDVNGILLPILAKGSLFEMRQLLLPTVLKDRLGNTIQLEDSVSDRISYLTPMTILAIALLNPEGPKLLKEIKARQAPFAFSTFSGYPSIHAKLISDLDTGRRNMNKDEWEKEVQAFIAFSKAPNGLLDDKQETEELMCKIVENADVLRENILK